MVNTRQFAIRVRVQVTICGLVCEFLGEPRERSIRRFGESDKSPTARHERSLPNCA